MKTTVFEVDGNDVKTTVQDEPAWQPFVEYEGKRLERVRVEDLLEPRGALMQLVEIAAGRTSPCIRAPTPPSAKSFAAAASSASRMGANFDYDAPELYVFLPGDAPRLA